MANSSFDKVIQQPYTSYDKTPNKKSKKGLIIFFLILVIILVAGAFFVIFYLKNGEKLTSKVNFLKYIESNNLQTVLDFNEYSDLLRKLQDESFEANSNIKFNANINETELKDVELNLNTKSNAEDEKSFSELTLNYLSNDLFNLKFLSSKDAIGIFSDEVLVKYVGSSYKNLGKVLTDVFNEMGLDIKEIDFSNFSNVANIILEKPTIPENSMKKYIDILNKNVEDDCFSEKNVFLERNTGTVNVMEYSMSINETKAIDIISQMLQTLEQDEELLDAILGSYSNLGISIDNVKMEIDNLINTLHEQEIDDAHIYTIKIYVLENQTIKTSIDLAGKLTIDLEYENEQESNAVAITVLDTENQDGISAKINKMNSSVGENVELELNQISENEIISKFDINAKLIDSEDSYELENTIQLTSSNTFNFDIDMTSDIEIKDVEVENLTEENCLFIDTLDEENFKAVVQEIKNQLNNVIADKMAKLLLIDTNINPTIIEQRTPEENNNEQAREEAKNKLIEAIGNAMYNAEQNNEEYTIQDLQNLSIEGSELSVNVSNNIAVIEIDGFTFNIDSDFMLSE